MIRRVMRQNPQGELKTVKKIVLIFNPNCIHCQNMRPKWEEMKKTLTQEVEEYDNEPEEEYMGVDAVLPSGDDLHKSKKSYPATAGGDNPMNVESIKDRLWAALNEKKKPDADGDGVPDWADKKPGKDDNEGKKKGSKPKKGEVPPQFKKK